MWENLAYAAGVPLQPQTFVALPREFQPEVAQQIADSIRNHGRVFFRVLGTSMSPAVPSESIVNVVAVEIASVRAGMLVAFARENRIFVHRVVSVGSAAVGTELITRGDALFSDDPTVSSQEFLGVVTAVIPPGHRSFMDRASARLRTLFAG